MRARSPKRVLADLVNDRSSNRIFEDITDDCADVVRIADHPIEPSFLPESLVGRAAIGHGRKLLADTDPTHQIALSGSAADEKVHVIRHEAVRNDFNAVACAGTQKLPQS